MIELLLAALGVLFVGATGAVLRSMERTRVENSRTVDALVEVLGQSDGGISEDVERRLMVLEDAVDRLPSKWDEVKREAKNFYQRAGHHVRRARTELSERGFADPELEQLSNDLLPIDGGGGSEEGLQHVRAGMAEIPRAVEEAEPQLDWNQITLMRKYGG